MRYSLLAGGKRIRPVLALATARAVGLRARATCCRWPPRIELIHTYSLIHDDLPAMDDDDLRRGQPDLPRQVRRGRRDPRRRRALRRGLPPPARRSSAGDPSACSPRPRELAAATGVNGMVGGQYAGRQPRGAGRRPTALRRLHELKTGRLIGASVALRTAAGRDRRRTCDNRRFRRFAAELGVLFQIVDDILDVTGTDDALGKPQGSDERTASGPT